MSIFRRFYLSLGSNLGKRENNLANAVNMLVPLGQDIEISSVYETSPVLDEPEDEHPDYLNMAVSIRSSLDPETFHQNTLAIEKRLGRFRGTGSVSRTIDIDVVAVDDFSSEAENLVVPHPRAGERRFVMEPLAEIHPSLRLGNKSASEICKGLRSDKSQQLDVYLGQSQFLELLEELGG